VGVIRELNFPIANLMNMRFFNSNLNAKLRWAIEDDCSTQRSEGAGQQHMGVQSEAEEMYASPYHSLNM
jgi:hypothetical protein